MTIYEKERRVSVVSYTTRMLKQNGGRHSRIILRVFVPYYADLTKQATAGQGERRRRVRRWGDGTEETNNGKKRTAWLG